MNRVSHRSSLDPPEGLGGNSVDQAKKLSRNPSKKKVGSARIARSGPIIGKKSVGAAGGSNSAEKGEKKAGKIGTKTKISSRMKKIRARNGAIIYVGRIPHGFYEKQMRSYFSQFGKILRIKISRNRRVVLLCPVRSHVPANTP